MIRMVRNTWFAALTVASLLLTGCAAAVAEPQQSSSPEASLTMPDGTSMSRAEHESSPPEDQGALEPSAAARMICAGQVVSAVTIALRLEDDVTPSSAWDAPMFSCTYDIDGAPLVLSVYDATDVAAGEQHFTELQSTFESAEQIEGMLGLGMPAFSTGDGIVGFLRDGKTLLVDATALPSGLADGTKTRDEVAYAVASAVLVCWVQHD
jgi:hypothetical protein